TYGGKLPEHLPWVGRPRHAATDNPSTGS
ncbi:MAG: GNAT family N-acetyltransferase, partial [Xanthomonas perforans]|nr:GNAT family N-acetyltransferase [Xanthomonas perforans]